MPGWYPITSGYTETYWLPIIGPSSWSIARRLYLMGLVEGMNELVLHNTRRLGRMIGVSVTRLERALGRLVMFGLASWVRYRDDTPPQLTLLAEWPPLPRRQLDRLSDVLEPPSGVSESHNHKGGTE